MYKLAVFDLDGTLLNSKHVVSKENLEAINLLRENNISVIIATGRSNELLKVYVETLNITEDIITCNGTVIGHPDKDIMLYEDLVPKEEVKRVLEMCVKYDHQFLVYTSKAIVGRKKDFNEFATEKNIDIFKEYNPNFIPVEDIYEIIDNYNINKVLIIERNPKKYIELSNRVKDYTKVSHTQSFKYYLDIGPLNNSKGNTVKILCKYLGIKLDEVMAFGDQLNDISMISIVGFGVAMGNAKDEVKQIADFVTLTNDENGVAHAINTKLQNLQRY